MVYQKRAKLTLWALREQPRKRVVSFGNGEFDSSILIQREDNAPEGANHARAQHVRKDMRPLVRKNAAIRMLSSKTAWTKSVLCVSAEI